VLHYLTIPVTAFQQNCSIVWDDSTMKGAIIDPGGDLDELLAACEQRGITLEQIWLTHAHIDHAGATAALSRRLQLPITGPHTGDQFWIDALPQQGAMFGFPPSESFTPTRWLCSHDKSSDTVTLGAYTFDVRHCPGHTPGHVIFYSRDLQRAFVGDVLFAGSIGRTDFPGGNHAQLLKSIREQLWPLGDETVFIPGHGPESSFGHERRTNPFVAEV
jgi:hydroxyacylglutathione hydrolase